MKTASVSLTVFQLNQKPNPLQFNPTFKLTVISNLIQKQEQKEKVQLKFGDQ